uniref:Candidate secreted effector n=1 Tax=Meloidogyne incognita TaxID=6306 RepID=A0A914MHT6_MELIC
MNNNKIIFVKSFWIFFVLFKIILAQQELDQYRQLHCTTPDGLTKAGPDLAKCRLILKDKEVEKGREAPTDDLGCFAANEKLKEEINSKNNKKTKNALNNNQKQQKRIICNLACPNASIWFHSPIEQGHKACFKGLGYGLEERENEWYIWRADKCLNSTATFTVGCKWKGKEAIQRFNILMKQKFPNDKALFEKLANGHLQ